jgi:nucleoside-diphosphate-sugar epimerase
MRLFCFGFGYSAEALARRLSARVSALGGTRTSLAGAESPLGAKLAVFQGDGASAEVRGLLAGTTHLLVSVPPDLEGDMVLRHFRDDLEALPELAWIGYLSTVGVYGDCRGEWVDETSPTRPTSERSLRRMLAEKAWLAFGAESGRRVEVFRLSGIYGPGRSVIDNLKAGTARRIVKPGQVFNRIHVDDIAGVLAAAIDQPAGHAVYNVSDDEPAPPQDVVAYAAELLGLPVPPDIPFERAGLSGMAASFWAESKRVSNARIKAALGVELAYPTYREGLRAIVAGR